jgi:CRP-like cAMP-binding protein
MSTAGPYTLKKVAFFSGLNDSAFDALDALCHRRSYEAGALIIGQLDQTFDVLFLLSGRARVNIYSVDGQRVSFREITPGAIFGELSAIDGQPRSASVEAVEKSSVVQMPQKVFLKALCEYPEFMTAVMRHLTQQIRRLTERVFEFSTLAVRNRVHAELLRIATGQATGNEAYLTPQPTHQEIASRISTHREAVTRELARLEEAGLIAKHGRSLHIRNVAELRRLVEHGDDT